MTVDVERLDVAAPCAEIPCGQAADAASILPLDRSDVEAGTPGEDRSDGEDSICLPETYCGPVSSLIDLPTMLIQACDEARRLLRVDVAYVYLVEEDGRSARWRYDSGLEPELRPVVRGLGVPIGNGIMGKAIQSGELLVTEDWVHDERFFDSVYREGTGERLGLRSVIAAPMIGHAGVLGALGAFDRTSRTFTEFERALMRALAGHIALAIENGRLNRALVDSESRLRYLLEQALDVIWSSDPDGHFTWVSQGSQALIGWAPDELIGREWRLVIAPESWDEVSRRTAELAAEPTSQQLFRVLLQSRDGRTIPAEIKQAAMLIDGVYAGAHGSVRDVSERDVLERELRSQAVELAASRERAHLAQELHDSVTQALFGMTLTTRSAEMLLRRDVDAASQKLTELRELARDALAEMRALIFELRPGSLAEEGLSEALRKHVAAVQGRTGLAVVMELSPVPRLPLEVEDALYRIAQEALHNIVKHASARSARVALRTDCSTVSLEVEDDGVGFDPQDIMRGHLGLAGIRTRVEMAKGKVSIQSRPGAGTKLRVVVPYTETACA